MEVSEKELRKVFLQKIKKTKQRFMDALLRCNYLEDQVNADALRKAINEISNTIAAISQKTAKLSDLKRFHINVDLIEDPEAFPATVSIELKQKERSHPLPLNHYVEIRPPVGEKVKTPLVRERGFKMQFSHKFNFGQRTPEIVGGVTSGDLEFLIMKISNYLGQRKVQTVALATAPLSQLSFSVSSSVPLHFTNIDGSRTQYIFDVSMNVEKPLVPHEDLIIDEIIEIIPE